MTVTYATEVVPWIEEDFSSYTSSKQLISGPESGLGDGRVATAGVSHGNQGYNRTTDQDVFLDQAKGYGGLTQSMRYTFPCAYALPQNGLLCSHSWQ
jgi:hypothetical protein